LEGDRDRLMSWGRALHAQGGSGLMQNKWKVDGIGNRGPVRDTNNVETLLRWCGRSMISQQPSKEPFQPKIRYHRVHACSGSASKFAVLRTRPLRNPRILKLEWSEYDAREGKYGVRREELHHTASPQRGISTCRGQASLPRIATKAVSAQSKSEETAKLFIFL
jgi:hypothetical protein